MAKEKEGVLVPVSDGVPLCSREGQRLDAERGLRREE